MKLNNDLSPIPMDGNDVLRLSRSMDWDLFNEYQAIRKQNLLIKLSHSSEKAEFIRGQICEIDAYLLLQKTNK